MPKLINSDTLYQVESLELMKKNIIILFYICFASILHSQTAEEVLTIIDRNQRIFSTLYFSAEMTIYSGSTNSSKSFFGFIQGDKTFIEYNNVEDLGFRYLKVKDKIWNYSPETKIILELPKESFENSMRNTTLSYNEKMNQTSYSNKHIAHSLKSVIINDVEILILKLKPKYNNETCYIEKELFITKKDYLIQKMICYTKNNNKLEATKEFIFKNYKEISHLKIPMTVIVRDFRDKNSYIIIKYKDIKINEPINYRIFTLKFLKD